MSLLDNIWVALQMFGVALLILVMVMAWGLLTSDSMNDKIWNDNSVSLDAKADGQAAVDNYDNMFAIIYIGFHLGILVLAFLLRNHPVMYVGAVLIIAVLMLIAAPLSNIWEDIKVEFGEQVVDGGVCGGFPGCDMYTDQATCEQECIWYPTYSTSYYITTLPKTDYIITNYPLFEMIWAFITTIVLLGVSRIE